MYDVEDAFWHKTYDMLYQKDKNIGFLLHEYGFSPDMEARGRSDGLCDIYLLANNDLYFPIVEDVKDEMDFVKKLPQAIWDWEMECYKIWNLDKDEYLSTSVCSPDNVVKHWISAAKPKSINNAFALYDKDVKEHMERLTACAEDLQVLGKFMELGINLYHESNELVLREL